MYLELTSIWFNTYIHTCTYKRTRENGQIEISIRGGWGDFNALSRHQSDFVEISCKIINFLANILRLTNPPNSPLVHKERPFLGVRNKEKKENGQLWQQPFIFNKYAILFFFLLKHVQLGSLSKHPFLHIDIFLKIIKGLNWRHSSAHLTKSHATYVYSSFWC